MNCGLLGATYQPSLGPFCTTQHKSGPRAWPVRGQVRQRGRLGPDAKPKGWLCSPAAIRFLAADRLSSFFSRDLALHRSAVDWRGGTLRSVHPCAGTAKTNNGPNQMLRRRLVVPSRELAAIRRSLWLSVVFDGLPGGLAALVPIRINRSHLAGSIERGDVPF